MHVYLLVDNDDIEHERIVVCFHSLRLLNANFVSDVLLGHGILTALLVSRQNQACRSVADHCSGLVIVTFTMSYGTVL